MSTFFGVALLLKEIFPEGPLPTGALAASVIAGVAIGHIVGNQIERAFPRRQFEYGPDWRKQKSRRTLLLTLATAVLFPLIIGLLV